MKDEFVRHILPLILGAIALAIACFLTWILITIFAWVLVSPSQNVDRCRAIAKSQAAEFATTGWRNDTCYLYKDGREVRVKL